MQRTKDLELTGETSNVVSPKIPHMKLASFDIGIKNMAYCIFDITPEGWSIVDWNVVDLLDSAPTTRNTVCGCLLHSAKTPKTANTKGKNHKSTEKGPSSANKPCGKKAKYYKENADTQTTDYFCEKHAKTQTHYVIPSKEYTLAHLRKQKVDGIVELYERLCVSGIPETNSAKKHPTKPEMIESIMKYYTSRLFSEIPVTKKNANDANLIQIGWAIRRSFDSSSHFAGITHVVIENQISPIATRMKTIQGMLAQYFIMKSTLENPVEIVFVSSSNKLRVGEPASNPKKTKKTEEIDPHPSNLENRLIEFSYETPNVVSPGILQSPPPVSANPNYKQHKTDGVALCSRFIESNTELSKWSGTMKVTKKDDLADCFLQGVWVLSNRNIITCAENLKINIVYLS